MKFSHSHIKEQGRFPADINLTSLVDIIFNLLLFYMLTASIAETPGIDVSLPKASSASVEKQNKSLSIVITSDQNILVNNKAVTRSELSQELIRFKKQENGQVFLRADKLAAHGNVVQILDLIRSKGIGQVSIATTKGD